MTHLLHPEVLEHAFLGGQMAERLESQAVKVLYDKGIDDYQPISILIRTRNDVENVERIAEQLIGQDYGGERQLVLVDTDSTDGTQHFSHPHLDVEVVPISQAEFNYPRALNRGLEAADARRIYSLVGHSDLSNNQTLRAVAKHLDKPEVGGAYGVALPGLNASKTERAFGGVVLRDMKPAAEIKKAGMGVLATNCAALDLDVCLELGGFDEAFAAGGEDTDLARRMLDAGFSVIREPLLSVHHSHGLGPINSMRQVRHWFSVTKGPQEFDAKRLATRRPDLDIS